MLARTLLAARSKRIRWKRLPFGAAEAAGPAPAPAPARADEGRARCSGGPAVCTSIAAAEEGDAPNENAARRAAGASAGGSAGLPVRL